MTTLTTPLTTRELDEPFAMRAQIGAHSESPYQTVRVRDFLRHVVNVAEQLPPARHVLNLCGNRYSFCVAFCAALLRRQCNLLANNRAEKTARELLEQYPDAYLLHDGLDMDIKGAVDIHDVDFDGQAHDGAVPEIPMAHIAAIAFTSGSTGKPTANIKTWRTFVESSAINAHHMLGSPERPLHTVATVPAQHMWGLETSVLLPLFAPLCILDTHPLFPQDIARQLGFVPSPRLLISTPIHLRALLGSGLQFAPVARVLCATAPLSTELATKSEALLGAELVEVYGCSEVGSMASRHSAHETGWSLFKGLSFIRGTEGLSVTAPYLPGAVSLQDHLHFDDTGRFELRGRSDDVINIGGKRGSLLEMNQILLAVEGVMDGVVFIPEAEPGQLSRPAALVVLDSRASKNEVLAEFRARLDPVFVPRPLIAVEALPREGNGKLNKARLNAFFKTCRARGTH